MIRPDRVQGSALMGDWCLNIGVRYLNSHLAPDCRRMVCLYAAVDVEIVIAAYRLIPAEVARIFRVVPDAAMADMRAAAPPAGGG
jgi:hypothetical protein